MGLLHDLGKIKPPFQRKLHGHLVEVSHSGEGARHALQALQGPFGKIVAYAIAGHHAGLPNGEQASVHRPPTPLSARVDQAEALALPDWLALQKIETPAPLLTRADSPLFAIQFLDEAQSLPVMFLHPCLAALNELVARYGCSVVFCTATQPAIYREQSLTLPEAPTLASTREIAPDPPRLFAALKRVEVQHVGPLDNAALAARLQGRTALTVVNNKRRARDLFDLLKGENVFHLTTNMTAIHRKALLATIRAQLDAGAKATVISTALIEAGVDISFPEVWRATAGIDSIARGGVD